MEEPNHELPQRRLLLYSHHGRCRYPAYHWDEIDGDAVIAYYNELDSYPAQWLRNLIDAGHIAPGTVDERDIRQVQPDDLAKYAQCHFFAGIAGWPYALRLAGWPYARPVWTGSCPCQPFSQSGKRRGTDDPRHLWPEWFRLIEECRPPVIFGEQVASKDGLAWLDLVYDDLESAGYAVAAIDLCAAGAGAPHIRQRLYFVAHADGPIPGNGRIQRIRGKLQSTGDPAAGELAHADRPGPARLRQHGGGSQGAERLPLRSGTDSFMGNAAGSEQRRERQPDQGRGRQEQAGRPGISSQLAISDGEGLQLRQLGGGIQPQNGSEPRPSVEQLRETFWSDCEWLPCRDGKARPTQPGLFPLASGIPARVGRLRAYGNAIVPELAAEFIRAYIEIEQL